MKILKHQLNLKLGGEKTLLFTADWQLGSKNCDEQRIRDDIRDAKNRNADIFIVGDVFDGVFAGDRRYRPSSAANWLVSSNDGTGDAVRRAAEILKSVAGSVRLVGLGNHEEAVIQRCATDMCGELAERLRAPAGDYCGYFEYRIPGCKPFVIHYDHGSGSDSMTRGVLPALRKKMHHKFDLYVTGHLHNRWCVDDVFVENGKLRPCKLLMVGSYLEPLNTKECGSTYDERWGLAPKPMGGVFVRLQRTKDNELKTIVEI